jgi:hypothetical protein
MAGAERKATTPTGLDELLAAARLDLAPDRHEGLLGSLAGVHQLLAGLDAVELGETPPATAFDARWK